MGCCFSRKFEKFVRVEPSSKPSQQAESQDTSYIEETFIEVGMRWKSSSKFVKVETSQQAELETFNEGVNNLFHFI